MNVWLNKKAYSTASYLVAPFALISIFIFICLYRLFAKPSKHPRLVWGPIPIISNKYWSNALRKAGFDSKTVMFSFQSNINKQEDFDVDIERLVNLGWDPLQRIFNYAIGPYLAFIYSVLRFDIFHQSFYGGFLGKTLLWRFEAFLLKLGRKKTINLAFGEDAFRYSQVIDPLLRHGLLMSFPQHAREEQRLQRRIDYWTRFADVIVTGFIIDGMGRWDILPFNHVVIDESLWTPKQFYSDRDGKNGVVKVIHTPNHRGCKGTEFLIQAVEALQAEDL